MTQDSCVHTGLMSAPPMGPLRLASLCLILGSAVCATLAQRPTTTPAPSPTPLAASQDDVIRVRTNLVQVDAVVTDKDGHQVKDLSASDFEIVENGQVHSADHCAYVSLVEPRSVTGSAALPTPGTLTASDLRRTFVFVVADPVIVIAQTIFYSDAPPKTWIINLKERPIRSAGREGSQLLRQFVDEKMGPNDLVAISSVEIDLGVLASYTSDKQVLHAAIERLSSSLSQSVPPVTISYFINLNGSLQRYTYVLDALIQQNLWVIETANKALAQVQILPGRKFLVLVSRGMVYNPLLPGSDQVRARMDQLIARANRAHVTFYTLSPTDIGNNGGSGTSGLSAAGLNGIEDIDSLVHLADETGGRAIYNTNDMSVGFDSILEENRGYYLLAYNPGAEATGRPHRIQVRVKRPGLHVSARAVAYAPEASDDHKPPTAAETFNTPLAVRDLKVALKPTLFPHANGHKSMVTTLTVDLTDVEARSRDAEGQGYALELMVRVAGPDGHLVEDKGRAITFRVKTPELAAALRDGLVSQFEFNADKPGYYRISVAVRDTVSGRVGSATRFIEVPVIRF